MNILKQSVEWAIALKHRFTNDIYFSTRLKIALCLTVFVALIIAGCLALVGYLKGIFMTGIVESLLRVIETGVSDGGVMSATNEQAIAALYFSIVTLLILAVICSIVVSRLALEPISQAFHIQKRFISGIAHELRTPLSILRMNNEIARLEMEPSSLAGELLDENIADIDMISEILNNLLLFDRMVSRGSLRFEEVNLQHVVKNTAQRLSSLARHKKIAINVTEDAIPHVFGSKTALEQVFFNIIKNAIAYTPKGGSVYVTYVERTEHIIRIRVSDTGIGIPAKDLPHIFEPFYRSEKTGKLSGTGIGLAIVFEIMKLHNGYVEVDSVEGEGTSFLLSFPIKGGAPDPSPRFPASLFSAHLLKKKSGV